ncbi:MAG: glycosyltransferase [Candidatus Methylopumilus sp.]
MLHIVESLDRGSVENWLLRMAAHARRRAVAIDWTFYCSLEGAGSNDVLARELGLRVVHTPVPIGHKLAFAQALRSEIARGRYDVLHSHHDLVSGFYLTAALGLPLRRRIVHVHNADEQVLTGNPVKKAVLRPVLRRLCFALADKIAANSNHSLDTFLAGRTRRAGRDVVHYLGIESQRFEAATGDRRALHLALGLPENALILLFAGRMTPEKNPVFAVDVLAELRRRRPEAIGVFVGSGSLEDAVRRRAGELGQAEAIRLLGWRDDVAEIMSASDWFILPHPEHPVEGFGIAVVEAQLAGLRLLLSRGVLDDPLLPAAVFRRLPLTDPPLAWAEAALDMLEGPAPSRPQALAEFKSSPMEMDRALKLLMQLYANGDIPQLLGFRLNRSGACHRR